MKDLVVLVADKNMEFTLRGALGRPESMGTRAFVFDVLRHPANDGGVRSTGAEILARERNRYAHALMLLDHEGSGSETMSALALEARLDAQLSEGWGDRAKSIVIAPELDVWMWGNDNVLSEVMNWPHTQGIRDWLRARKFEFDGSDKPLRPKEALEALTPVHRLPRSSSMYEAIASKISLRRCTDRAFLRMQDALRIWFAPTPTAG